MFEPCARMLETRVKKLENESIDLRQQIHNLRKKLKEKEKEQDKQEENWMEHMLRSQANQCPSTVK